MSDQEIRQLEVMLARDPADLIIRQQLLAAYQRTGKILPNEMLDLAALGDAGAIALTGKTPNLESRSKMFYLRCGWAAVLRALKQLAPPADFYQLVDTVPLNIPNPAVYRQHLRNDLDKTYNAIEVFNTLMSQYLARSINRYYGLPVSIFQAGSTANLGNFVWIFDRLREYFQGFLRTIETSSTALVDDKYSAMENLVLAYWFLAKGVNDAVKKHTDDAIYSAAVSILHSQGLSYWPLAGDYSDPRRSLLQIAEGETTERQYSARRAKELLISCRPDIIRQWLPGYTP